MLFYYVMNKQFNKSLDMFQILSQFTFVKFVTFIHNDNTLFMEATAGHCMAILLLGIICVLITYFHRHSWPPLLVIQKCTPHYLT